jgi:two-component system KDP operon response regulator KdpE
MSGLDVCRALRVWYDGPCLFLSVKNSPSDKIAALDLGGDDYLTKPFHPGELLARVRASLRRHGHADAAHSFTAGDLTIDFAARRVILAGCELALTRTEYTILALLVQHAGKVLNSRHIAAQVLGGDSADDLHTLRVHISNLRKKLHQLPDGPRYIVTVPGVGFRFVADGG